MQVNSSIRTIQKVIITLPRFALIVLALHAIATTKITFILLRRQVKYIFHYKKPTFIK